MDGNDRSIYWLWDEMRLDEILYYTSIWFVDWEVVCINIINIINDHRSMQKQSINLKHQHFCLYCCVLVLECTSRSKHHLFWMTLRSRRRQHSAHNLKCLLLHCMLALTTEYGTYVRLLLSVQTSKSQIFHFFATSRTYTRLIKIQSEETNK